MSDRTKGTVGRREFLGAAAGAGVLILKPERVWGTTVNSAPMPASPLNRRTSSPIVSPCRIGIGR